MFHCHTKQLSKQGSTNIFFLILTSPSVHILAMSLVIILDVASLTIVSFDVVSFILIIEPRYLKFGHSSISVLSMRTGHIRFRAILFVFASLILAQLNVYMQTCLLRQSLTEVMLVNRILRTQW